VVVFEAVCEKYEVYVSGIITKLNFAKYFQTMLNKWKSDNSPRVEKKQSMGWCTGT